MPDRDTAGVVQLQRVTGNRGIQRSLKQNSIQRLMSADQMIALAGEPQKDRFFGLKKMSGKYKAVLDAMREYDALMGRSVGTMGSRYPELMLEFLDRIVTACNTYVADHEGDTRTKHIVKLRDVDIPKEREAVNVLASSEQMREQFANQTVGEAISYARDANMIQKAINTVNKPTPGQDDQNAAKQRYATYLSGANTGLTDLIVKESSAGGSQPFRGSDELTKQGKQVALALGQDYVKTTVMPLMSSILTDMIGKKVATSPSVLNAQEQDLNQNEREVRPATIELINKLYGRMVQGLLINSKGGIAVPQDILDAAADTFARVYVTTENNPDAQHSAMQTARISVVNMIFLRFINGVLADVGGQLDSDTGMRFIFGRLSNIFQAQANGIDIVKKFPELSESQDMALAANEIIEQVVGSVVESGMLKAQLLRTQKVGVFNRQRRGAGFVLGSRPTVK